MTKTKVKIFKTIYYVVNFMIALAICYLGSLVLDADLVTAADTIKLIAFIGVAFMLILSEGLLSYKLHHIEQ